MSEVFYLEPDEEITNVIDRIKKNPADQIILVAPRMTALIQSVVNLKLLKGEAESLGKEIALVTQDSVGRNLAAQVGLPVYESINQRRPIIQRTEMAPKTDDVIEIDLSNQEKVVPKGVKVHHFQSEAPKPAWKPSDMPISKPKVARKSKKILFLALSGILIGLVFLALFLPSATVTLAVKGEPFERSVSVQALENITVPLLAEAKIPAHRLEVTQTKDGEFISTGTKNVGEKSSGEATLYNETGVSQKVASGTILTSPSGLKFVTQKEVNIPAGSLDANGNIVAGTVKVNIQSQSPGEQYNLSSTNYSMAGFSDKIYAKGGQMSGGSTKQVKVVSQSDLETAQKELEKQALEASKEQIKSKAGKDEFLDNALNSETVSFEANKKADDESEKFKASIKIKVITLLFSEDDFQKIVLEKLRAEIPSDKDIVLTENNKIAATMENQDLAQGLLTINGKLVTKLVPKIDYEGLKKEIRSKTLTRAKEISQGKSGEIKTVEIKTKPGWWKLMPLIKKKIAINFNYL